MDRKVVVVLCSVSPAQRRDDRISQMKQSQIHTQTEPNDNESNQNVAWRQATSQFANHDSIKLYILPHYLYHNYM